jgi:pimeloyl-ACP methyl ester carboxylesterase
MADTSEDIRQGFFDIPGGRVAYQWYPATRDASTSLVFLHEGLGSVELWREFPARVAAASGRAVLVYSRLGYGYSDPVPLPRPLTYMHHEAGVCLPAVLDAAAIERCILLGHSDGASIALINAGAVRDARVAALVLMAPHVFNEPISVASIEKAREAYPNGLRDKLKRYHGDNVDCAFRGWNDAWLDPGFATWNIEAFLSPITIPMLIIQGLDDEYGTLEQVRAIEQQSGGPVNTLLLEQCRHSPFRDREQATLDAIVDFIEAVDTVPTRVD